MAPKGLIIRPMRKNDLSALHEIVNVPKVSELLGARAGLLFNEDLPEEG